MNTTDEPVPIGTLSVDDLFERKLDADREEHLARRASEKHPEDRALFLAWEDAAQAAKATRTAYLDALIAEQERLATQPV